MENDLISVIVPVYNREKTLYKTVDSIINQTYKNLEIIIINDGSTDNTEQLCDKLILLDSRINYWSIDNLGQANARNKGIEQSTGKYLVFIDSDDIIEENMIELLYNSIVTNNSDVCICGITFDYINQQYSISKKYKKDCSANKDNAKSIIEESFNNGMLYSPCNKIYTKKIIEDNDLIFKVKQEPIEDILFNCEYLSKCNNMSVIKESPYHYIKLDDNSTVTKYNQNLWDLSVKRSNAIKSLFEHFNMTSDQHIRLLYQEYIGGKSDCIINCYRKGSNLSFLQKVNLVNKFIIKDDYLVEIIKNINVKEMFFDQKILVYCVKLKSSFLMVIVYNILFFAKNNLKELYFKYRKKSILRN